MDYVGQVRNGVVVMEDGVPWAEGTQVRVEPIEPLGKPDLQEALATLAEGLQKVAGQAGGLPSDLARNHDHYLHGRPRQ
jgi:hypothetical protein